MQAKAWEVVSRVNQVILGKEREVEEVLLAFLAGGHILLEDIPGTGKTTLALAFSRAMELDCRRVQFTPDVMPSDLTGFSIYRREEERFVYQPGSVFCNLLLADEINRTSPKTQSALLEVMEERKVSVEGVTRPVPRPFLVIATQNPAGSAGTQLLPEAQVDRFMVSLSLGYPDFQHELAMAMDAGEGSRADGVRSVISREDLLNMQQAAGAVYLHEAVARYILELVTATREHPYFSQGAGPRATVSLVRLSKAMAWYEGRDYVTPADVYAQFPFAAAHRVVLNTAAKLERRAKADILREIADRVRRPRVGRMGR
ncbi:MAG: MoxR family ATPase [Oscillibacter sp.]|nr:MoxR family ATPase [Oscillibacter sp.]